MRTHNALKLNQCRRSAASRSASAIARYAVPSPSPERHPSGAASPDTSARSGARSVASSSRASNRHRLQRPCSNTYHAAATSPNPASARIWRFASDAKRPRPYAVRRAKLAAHPCGRVALPVAARAASRWRRREGAVGDNELGASRVTRSLYLK